MTGRGGRAAGIDPERVAEVLVELDGIGPGRRGSGYRVSAEAVLTAAHVVRDASTVRVRFDADRSGEWVAEGRVAWSDPGVDVAVVTIAPRPDDSERVAPVGFGRVAERDAVLECSAMGFPLFKLRDDPAPAGVGVPSIPNLYERAKAWVAIAERLTAADRFDPAADDPLHQRLRRLLAEILAGERWLDALEPLGRLDPAALAAVDRELQA